MIKPVGKQDDMDSQGISSAVSGVSLAAHTPGPWCWFGNQHGIYLATDHSGRRYVMAFRRMGTQGAQPVFQVASRMTPAADLVEFEVGDQTARGFTQGRADGSVYRYDIRGIDCPDARLIAAAPDLLEALQKIAGGHQPPESIGVHWAPAYRGLQQIAAAAIAKALGP